MVTKQTDTSGWFDKNRRKLSGIGYLIGDAALAIEGMINLRQGMIEGDAEAKRKGIKELAVGGGYAIGGTAMAKYGNRTVDAQCEALKDKLAAHLSESGVNLDKEYLERALREKNKSFFQKIEDFCYRYPTEILNVTYAALSTLLVSEGIKEYQQGKKEGKTNVGTLGMGVLIISGALAGLLVKEKSAEQLEAEGKTGVGAYLQKNSLALNGGLYFANNFFTAKSSFERYKQYNDPQKPQDAKRGQSAVFKNLWMLRAVTAATYMGSNISLMGAKKGASGDADLLQETRDQLLADTAAIIDSQPALVQKEIIAKTADYLLSRKELNIGKISREKLVEKLNPNLKNAAEDEKWTNRTQAVSTAVERGV